MPLLFSYGTLQQEGVQLSTLGRRLVGGRDELVGAQSSQVPITDAAVAAEVGNDHHANVIFNNQPESRVFGMVFEVTFAELAQIDGYEAPFSYRRVAATLASGRQAWVYVHAPGGRGSDPRPA